MDFKQFWEEIENKKIAMCGIGISNTPLIKTFLKKGARVVACDRRTREQLGSICDELENAGTTLSLGEDYLKKLEVDVIFRTPGMSFNLPELKEARRRGIAVTSEMEVFFDLCPAKIFAVTGSDGKTTTTTLIAKMLEKEGYTVTEYGVRINGANKSAKVELTNQKAFGMLFYGTAIVNGAAVTVLPYVTYKNNTTNETVTYFGDTAKATIASAQ